ncbi:unnamed protein product [Prunus armeniaca]|uniref:Uncharacterized protein n=1 Tax=Prunus armeniaca TaxID=36596 RepID=A0A6J5WF07_PRUAR|nr:unnamed protein product [Prunus armeniaca]
MKDIWEAHKLNPPYLYKAQLQSMPQHFALTKY